MKTRSWFSKLLTASLAVLMLAGMTPVDTSAAPREAEETEPGSNLFLDKTATLQNDGTYTIQMEAFSTGESTTVMTQTPTDIVLVLDVSGSMDDPFTYVSGQEWTSVKDRVYHTPEDAYHHCPDGSYSPITWTETGTLGVGRYRYVCDNCHASRKWDTPTTFNNIPGEGDDDSWNLWRYTDIERTEEKMVALKEAVNSFLSSVAGRNANIGEADQQHRVAIVKFASERTSDTIGNDTYRDGYYEYNYTQTIAGMTTVTADSLSSLTGAVDELTPGGATAADKGLDMAQSILNNSADSNRNKVVIFFTDGEPTYGNSFSATVANNAVATAKNLKDSGTTIYTIGLFSGADPSDTSGSSNAYMNGVSSNYPNATSYKNLGSGGNNGYYKTVSATGSLSDIFEEIEDSISTTTVTLTAEAELRDILNTGFVLTEDSDVTVQTDTYSGRDRYGNRVFADTPQDYSAAVINKENNTIKVSGFDFSKEYLIDGDTPDDSDFTAAKQGRKLIITITNVEATDDAVTDNLISTNNAASGIYENADATTPFALFKQPQTQLSSKAYVLDYAQETTLTELPNSVTHMDAAGMHGFAQAATSLNMEYGVASDSTYTPKTMLWNGYDKYYVFGKWNTTPEGVTTGHNTWTKVSVLPANNVYYEDTFITNTDDGTGTVGIVYDSENWTLVSDENAGTNKENANGNIQGWEEALNETGDSDGTMHMTSEKGATATFTLTGTGFDVYSRTNMTSGKVFAKISWTDSEGTKHNKGLFVDTVSASGEYYGVPTLWFSGEYNTYTVTLAVQSNATGSYSYCIDGIRIYNPLNPELEDTDSTVQDSYDEELKAHFETVRSFLLSAGDLDRTVNEETGEIITPDQQVNGVVFIDKTADGETGASTDDIGVYEDYGSKSEVYLAPGQAIAFNVGVPGLKVQIGLKAPEGQSVTAKWSNGGTAYEASSLNHTTDMYYTAVADDSGFIVVENASAESTVEGIYNLLSVTKIKFLNADDGVAETSLSGMTEAVSRFSAMPVTAYDLEAETELPETDVTENETETETEPETEPVEEPSLDVVIENPETETEETTTGGENSANNSLAELLNSLFSSFRRWF